MSNLLKFPLRPAAHQAYEQSIFMKLGDMGLHNAFVIGTDANGLPTMFCDPELGIGQALYLLESARFRLMSGYRLPPPPPSPPKGPA